MTKTESTPQSLTLVAVDIAKKHNEVLIEPPGSARRRRFRVANELADYERLAMYLREFGPRTGVGFEATGNYHGPLAHFLQQQGLRIAADSHRRPGADARSHAQLLGQE